MEQKALKLIMAGLLILSMALTGREAAEYVGAMHAVNALRETGMGADDSGRLCVVVDAGHGGDDRRVLGRQAPGPPTGADIARPRQSRGRFRRSFPRRGLLGERCGLTTPA